MNVGVRSVGYVTDPNPALCKRCSSYLTHLHRYELHLWVVRKSGCLAWVGVASTDRAWRTAHIQMIAPCHASWREEEELPKGDGKLV